MNRLFGYKGLRPIPVRVGHEVARYPWIKAPAPAYPPPPPPARKQIKPK